MKCTNCDYENASDANFCRKCGMALPKQPEKEDEKLCKKCGFQLHPEAIFCKKCGTPVETVSTSETKQLNLHNEKNQPSLNQKTLTKQNREQIKKTKESPQGKATKKFHLKKPVILIVAIIVVLITGVLTIFYFTKGNYVKIPSKIFNEANKNITEQEFDGSWLIIGYKNSINGDMTDVQNGADTRTINTDNNKIISTVFCIFCGGEDNIQENVVVEEINYYKYETYYLFNQISSNSINIHFINNDGFLVCCDITNHGLLRIYYFEKMSQTVDDYFEEVGYVRAIE